MSTPSPEAIKAAIPVRARQAAGGVSTEKPGALSKWQDESQREYWEFVGNGTTTGTQFVRAVAEREAAEGHHDLKKAVDLDVADFARRGAQQLLKADNPDAPIARGEARELSLKELVGLVGPFLQDYARRQASAHSGSAGKAQPVGGESDRGSDENDHKRVTGDVSSQGLTLPID